MADIPLLWTSGARKESMALLRRLWTDAPAARQRLADAIVAGPPQEMLEHIDAAEREQSRDRRVFDRLVALRRLGEPPLTANLVEEWARLTERYPHWRAPEGEQADFPIWSGTSDGPDTHHGVDDLKKLADDALMDVLLNEQELREGLLDAWRQLAVADPGRVVSILDRLNHRAPPAPIDVWYRGLWGVRDNANEPSVRAHLLALLVDLPPELLGRPEMSRAVADVLEAMSKKPSSSVDDDTFWRVFDLTLAAAALDPDNADLPEDRDWVSLAINRSMGSLATAFLAALFARRLTVGAGLPEDLRPRLNILVARDIATHRPSRVVVASRLSYLYAVDPAWARVHLVPNFDWATDEEEALAAWQGYAWQPRIDEKLWQALKPHFMGIFTPARLNRIGDMGRSLAQLLMLIGVEFGLEEVARDDARNAIRAMPEDLRSDALSWVASYLEAANAESGPTDARERPARNSDRLWTEKVRPWLERVWPPDPGLRSPSTSEQFAMIAIATQRSFPDSVDRLVPHMVTANGFYALHQLRESSHPDDHPREVIRLIDALIDPNQARFGDDDLTAIVERARRADPDIVNLAAFRIWSDRVRAQQR